MLRLEKSLKNSLFICLIFGSGKGKEERKKILFEVFFQKVSPMQFDVGRDIETIHKACKGLGTDEKALLSVVCNRPKEYLQFLRQVNI